MRHISLFSGIGGFTLAGDRLGIKTIQHVEIDSTCQKILKRHYPRIPIHDDVTTYCPERAAADIITFGSPCQDFSVANADRRGLEGERSGLFFDAIRVVRRVQPRYVVFENVPGIFTRGFERILWAFSQSGYDAEWQTISAGELGAPHLRSRVFVVAYPQGFAQQDGSGKTTSTRAKQISLGSDSWWGQNPAPEPTIRRMDYGVPPGVDSCRLTALGNAVTPQQAKIALQRVIALDKLFQKGECYERSKQSGIC